MSSTAGAAEMRTTTTVAMARDLSTAIWLTVWLLGSGLSLFLTWRRLVGALLVPPSGAAMAAIALVLCSAAALLRCLAGERRSSVLATHYSVPSTRITNVHSLPPHS